MPLTEELKKIQCRIKEKIDSIKTEEATKDALVRPFIKALGYDIFDPTEMVSEYTCDYGTKKGEKVDFAIFQDNIPIILIECKHCKSELTPEDLSQLHRYFNVSYTTKFAILTNGIKYRFYTETQKPNILDTIPFFEIDLSNFDFNNNEYLQILEQFTKSNFDSEKLFLMAQELIHKKPIEEYLKNHIFPPSDEFIKFIAKELNLYQTNPTSSKILILKNSFKKALQKLIKEIKDKEIPVVIEKDPFDSISPPPPPLPHSDFEESYDSMEIPIKSDYTNTQPRKFIFKGEEIYTFGDKFNRLPRKPEKFIFKGEEIYTNSWSDLWVKFIEKIWQDNKERFDLIYSIQGRNRSYFSKNSKTMKRPKKLLHLDLYIERDFSAEKIYYLCTKIIEKFGYSEDDFKIVLTESGEYGDNLTDTPPPHVDIEDVNEPLADRLDTNYNNTHPQKFILRGEEIPVYSWMDLRFKFLEKIWQQNRDSFEKILEIKGSKKHYFSKNPNSLQTPKKLPFLDIYFETNFEANNIVRVFMKVLDKFGYSREDFKIIVK